MALTKARLLKHNFPVHGFRRVFKNNLAKLNYPARLKITFKKFSGQIQADVQGTIKPTLAQERKSDALRRSWRLRHQQSVGPDNQDSQHKLWESPGLAQRSPVRKGVPGPLAPGPQRVRHGVRKESKKSPKLRFWTIFRLRGALCFRLRGALCGESGAPRPGAPPPPFV